MFFAKLFFDINLLFNKTVNVNNIHFNIENFTLFAILFKLSTLSSTELKKSLNSYEQILNERNSESAKIHYYQ